MKKTKMLLLACSILGTVFLAVSCDKGNDCGDAPPTYTSEMKAIIDAKCVNCHKAGGSAESIGIYSTYNEMKPNFASSWQEVKAGRMPKGGGAKLTDAEKDAFECWQKAGFPEN
jgi:uncharacterized membrane protein